MKLAVRMAGLCGSAAFIVTALPAFFQQFNPNAPLDDALLGLPLLGRLGISLLGALIAGILGYMAGNVLSKPAGRKKTKPAPAKPVATPALPTTEAVTTATLAETLEQTSTSAENTGNPNGETS